MTLIESWKQSLQYAVAGRKKLFLAVVFKGVIRTWVHLVYNWVGLVSSLMMLMAGLFYYAIDVQFISTLLSATLLVLTALASRTSLTNKNYHYLREKINHALVGFAVCFSVLWYSRFFALPQALALIDCTMAGFGVYNPLLILWLFFYNDAPAGGASFLRAFKQAILMVILQLPFMALSAGLCMIVQVTLVWLVSFLFSCDQLLYAELAIRSGISMSYVSLLGTVYTLLIHRSFDRYFSSSNKSLRVILHSIVSWTLVLIISLVCVAPLYLLLLIGQKSQRVKQIYFWWEYLYCWLIVKAAFVPVTVTGEKHLAAVDQAIIIANHQSSLDIPVLVTLMKGHSHVWLAHVWLLKSLFLRTLLPKVAILVDTDTPMSAGRSLLQVHKQVSATNDHIVIFPEGGRYIDSMVHDFFAGYVILAKKLQKPIVPVYIHGLNKVFPPQTPWVQWTPVMVVIGEPTMQHDDETDQMFNQRMHEWFKKQNQKMKES